MGKSNNKDRSYFAAVFFCFVLLFCFSVQVIPDLFFVFDFQSPLPCQRFNVVYKLVTKDLPQLLGRDHDLRGTALQPHHPAVQPAVA